MSCPQFHQFKRGGQFSVITSLDLDVSDLVVLKGHPGGAFNAAATTLATPSIRQTVPGQSRLDDIVFASNLKEHQKYLETVFKTLKSANFCVRKDKCVYAMTQVKFLGFKDGNEVHRPTSTKVLKMFHFSTSTCKKDINQFLGFTSQN